MRPILVEPAQYSLILALLFYLVLDDSVCIEMGIRIQQQQPLYQAKPSSARIEMAKIPIHTQQHLSCSKKISIATEMYADE